MAFVATFIGGAALSGLGAGAAAVGLGTVGAGAVAGTGVAGALAGAAGSGLIAGAVGGGLIGAGVGQLTGGNTKSTLTGMGIGAGAGALAGGMFGVGGSGGWLTGGGAAQTATPATFEQGITQFGGSLAAKTATPAAAGATGGSLLSSVLTNPILLGTAGFGLASAFSDKGQSFQDRIKYSKEGKELMYGKVITKKKGDTPAVTEGGYVNAVKDQYAQALSGQPSERAFQDVSNAKVLAENKKKSTDSAFLDAQAKIANTNRIDRGGAAPGGSMAGAAYAAAGESMQGKFAPTSILNNYSREDMMNAMAGIQNIQNFENQTASINYQGSLAKWSANNYADAQKGAALGGTASLVGTFMQNQAYMNRLNSTKIA